MFRKQPTLGQLVDSVEKQRFVPGGNGGVVDAEGCSVHAPSVAEQLHEPALPPVIARPDVVEPEPESAPDRPWDCEDSVTSRDLAGPSDPESDLAQRGLAHHCGGDGVDGSAADSRNTIGSILVDYPVGQQHDHQFGIAGFEP